MNILELFHYTFFQHALLGSLFASIACGIIGTYIVTRRLELRMPLSEESVSACMQVSPRF